MAKNTSMSIGQHFSDFIEGQVRSGRYGSASDVVRAGLRLLEEREARMRVLGEALAEGEASGTPRAFDRDAFAAKMRLSDGG